MAEKIDPFMQKALGELALMTTSGECKYFDLVTGEYLRDAGKDSGNIILIANNEAIVAGIAAMQFELEAKGRRTPTSSSEH